MSARYSVTGVDTKPVVQASRHKGSFEHFALMACMAASSGLLWFNYRGVDFSGAEETIYGALFGVSVFGVVLSLLLVLMV